MSSRAKDYEAGEDEYYDEESSGSDGKDVAGAEDEESEEEESDTGLTENQNRLLYLLSLYTHPAQSAEEDEEWVRKSALLVLIYEGILARVFDYDYAPASSIVEGRRLYLNMTQEGKSDVDFLREEELVNGLKLASTDYQPVTCFQISTKGLDLVRRISRGDREAVHELAFAPSTHNVLQVRWDGDEMQYMLEAESGGYSRASNITETEDVSYVSSAYVPQCLRHGGRPTLSNAHRAHESGATTNIQVDNLEEIITLNSVSIIVTEYVPFGANHIVQLNQNLGSFERVQGGFFTALVDDNPSSTRLNVSPGLTNVQILDHTLTGHVNLEADIHYPEAPGIVQVETFGVSLNANGSAFYGMQLEAVMDRIKDTISLDHLARLLVDVHVDTSKIVDSMLSAYQRSLLELVFRGDAPNRDKVNLILCNEITPHLTAEEYIDKGEYENELKQVLGDTRAAYDISEHDTLVFGEHGILVAGPNSRHHEPLLVAFMQFSAMDIFVRNFFSRMFLVQDDMKAARIMIEESDMDPTSVPRIRAKLAVVSRHLIMLEEVLGFLQESLDTVEVPPEPPEQAGRALYERLSISKLREEISLRVTDLKKNLSGSRRELEVLERTGDAVTAQTMQGVQEGAVELLHRMTMLQETGNRSTSTLEVMQIVLAGTLSFEILDRFVGEWTVLSTAWGSSLFTPLVQDAPLLWFILSLMAWAGTAYMVLRVLRKRFYKDEGNIHVRLRPMRPINVPALMNYINGKPVMDEDRHYRHRYGDEAAGMGAGGLSGKGGASARGLVTSRWSEEDKEEWGGVCPNVEVQIDETNGYLMQLNMDYNKHRAKEGKALTSEELQSRMLRELNRVGVFRLDQG